MPVPSPRPGKVAGRLTPPPPPPPTPGRLAIPGLKPVLGRWLGPVTMPGRSRAPKSPPPMLPPPTLPGKPPAPIDGRMGLLTLGEPPPTDGREPPAPMEGSVDGRAPLPILPPPPIGRAPPPML